MTAAEWTHNNIMILVNYATAPFKNLKIYYALCLHARQNNIRTFSGSTET